MIKKNEGSKVKENTKTNYKDNLVIQSSLKYKNFNEKRNNTKMVIVRPK